MTSELPPWPELTGNMKDRQIAERVADLAVGKIGFIYDDHNRVYPASVSWRDRSGITVSQRHFYVATVIIGETRQSWITARYGKILKRGRAYSFGVRPLLLGLQDVEDRLWWIQNRVRIVRAFDTYGEPTLTYDKLRRVAAIIDEP